jgi:hypothetical protein
VRRRIAELSNRFVWWMAFVAIVLVGGAFALGIPIGGQPDEPAHLVKASALYRGELTWAARGPRVIGTGPTDPTRTEIELNAPAGYADLDEVASCLAALPRRDATCSPPVANGTALKPATDTYAVAYPPLPYALMGWPTVLFEPSKAIYLVRLSNVAICAALIASAVVAARELGRGWPVLGVGLAVTPTALVYISSPNPNGLEIAAATTVAVSLLALLAQEGPPTTRAVARLVVAASLLVLCRPLSLAVLGCIVTTALVGAATRARVRELFTTASVRRGLVAVAVASFASLSWLLFARPLEVVVGIPLPGIGTGEAVRESLSRLPERGREMVGVFGWGEVPAPPWMWWTWSIAAATLVILAFAVGTRRARITLVGVILTNAALPTVMEVPQAEVLGFIWQGRYSLPFAVIIPIYAAWVIGQGRCTAMSAARVGAWPLAGVVGVALVGAHGISLTRFATGRIEPWYGYLRNAAWQPEVPPAVLFGAVIVGAALWGLAVVVAARPEVGQADAESSERTLETPAVAASAARV